MAIVICGNCNLIIRRYMQESSCLDDPGEVCTNPSCNAEINLYNDDQYAKCIKCKVIQEHVLCFNCGQCKNKLCQQI